MFKLQKAKRNTKRFIAVALLIIILFILVSAMQIFLCIPNTTDENRIIGYHKEPANSLDVVFIGSSTIYSGFASGYAYDLYGYTSYPYVVGGSTCTFWKPALIDVLHTQTPKLIVVDVFGGGYIPKLVKSRNSQIYNVMAHMPLSTDKISLAVELSKTTTDNSFINYLFPFFKYHDNVPVNAKKLLKHETDIYTLGASPLKGIETITKTSSPKPLDESFLDETLPLDKDVEKIIRSFMDICKEKKLNVLFIKYPSVISSDNQVEKEVSLRSNTILRMAEEYGFSTLNLQRYYHDMNLNQYEDFYNHGHTNIRGQKKITEFLGKYIQDEMNVEPSILSSSVKAEWENSAKYFYSFAELAEKQTKKESGSVLADTPELVESLK